MSEPRTASTGRAAVGTTVTHRRYVSHAEAHYGGALLDGAYVLGLFGDVATEMCLRTDGDEGLLAGYSSIAFRAPVKAGDVVEVTATITRVGTRSRTLDLRAYVCCRATPEVSESAGCVLDPPLLVVEAVADVVVPPTA
ncbi:hotdog domain-containing protein [Sporichthya polymorpha]|uniref:3-aminobutyryl-CoA ammonia lyase n=1 Tax=Sporichthya polymorpha TaxID=35751 RepID=UPI000380A864|nr:hotdog domain-containing protein [Sporichthya polymorpha]